LAAIVIVAFFMTGCARRTIYEVPEGYTGWVTLHANRAECQRLPGPVGAE